MTDYDHKKIEKKWQKRWEETGLYRVSDLVSGKENFYTLVELPYPSGDLHVGHWAAFAVPDIFARMKRMQGYNSLYPIGFDAFGLPAENAAIKHGADPAEWTWANIDRMRDQLKQMGNMFDWNREVSACDPAFYRWTQWLFLQLFKKDLAYRKKGLVNWCPKDQTVLANEQVIDGKCERCDSEVEKKELEQWYLKITKYADRLIDDLEDLDWPEPIKESQRNWIGRSEGAEIDFSVAGSDKKITVFTTRPDTLYGATYMVLAPEHPFVSELDIENRKEVEAYVKQAQAKTEMERTAESKEKTGVELKGIKVINPATKEEIPIFVADYVLAGYGTGAIMAVPAHDKRDLTFAKKFRLPIRVVVKSPQDYENVNQKILEDFTKEIFQFAMDNDFRLVLVGGAASDLEQGRFGIHSDIDVFVDAKGLRLLSEKFDAAGLKSATRNGDSTFHEWNNHRWFFGNDVWIDVFLLEEEHDSYFDAVGKEKHLWSGSDIFKQVTFSGVKITIPSNKILQEIDSILSHNWNFCYSEPGVLVHSGSHSGLPSETAKKMITESVGGRITKTFRQRDWLISRQRYWGTPIPIVYDADGKPHAIPDEHLPWLLPTDVDFTPTGVAPLARSKELKERTEKLFGKGWTPEVDTMDTFMDSSWYFLRYLDPKNKKEFCSKELQKAWMPVNRYSGGAEHTTMHILYSRFFIKALYDLGLVTESEPYKQRMNRGLILAEDGRKMSKRWGNVVNPDEQVANVGADSVKMYLAFIGPYNEVGSFPWNTNGLIGVRRFLERVWALSEKLSDPADTARHEVLRHQTIKKVGDDIESMKFNTSVSALMIYTNELQKSSEVSKEDYETLLRLLAPFAPHMTEELWERLGHSTSIHLEEWPQYDNNKAMSENVVIVFQINGKRKGSLSMTRGSTEAAVVESIKNDSKLVKYLDFEPKKVIFVPDRIINFVA